MMNSKIEIMNRCLISKEKEMPCIFCKAYYGSKPLLFNYNQEYELFIKV